MPAGCGPACSPGWLWWRDDNDCTHSYANDCTHSYANDCTHQYTYDGIHKYTSQQWQ
jgi:hypothetical protein